MRQPNIREAIAKVRHARHRLPLDPPAPPGYRTGAAQAAGMLQVAEREALGGDYWAAWTAAEAALRCAEMDDRAEALEAIIWPVVDLLRPFAEQWKYEADLRQEARLDALMDTDEGFAPLDGLG